MVILAGLEAFLEPLGTSLERSWDFWLIFGATEIIEVVAQPGFGGPPLPKLLAKANSDYTTAKLLTANC